MSVWVKVLAVGLGGAIGANARYWLGLGINRLAGTHFPWSTLAINVSGSLALGYLAVAMGRLMPGHPARLLVLVGVLGGYTTFSTFSVEALGLWQRAVARSLVYLIGSTASGVVAAALGAALAGGPAHARPQHPVEVHRTQVPASEDRP